MMKSRVAVLPCSYAALGGMNGDIEQPLSINRCSTYIDGECKYVGLEGMARGRHLRYIIAFATGGTGKLEPPEHPLRKNGTPIRL